MGYEVCFEAVHTTDSSATALPEALTLGTIQTHFNFYLSFIYVLKKYIGIKFIIQYFLINLCYLSTLSFAFLKLLSSLFLLDQLSFRPINIICLFKFPMFGFVHPQSCSLYGYAAVCLSIHLLVHGDGIQVVPKFVYYK